MKAKPPPGSRPLDDADVAMMLALVRGLRAIVQAHDAKPEAFFQLIPWNPANIAFLRGLLEEAEKLGLEELL